MSRPVAGKPQGYGEKRLAIDEVLEPAAGELAAVEAVIHKSLLSGDSLLVNPVTHLLDHGGKRLRPALVILSALCYRYDARRVVPAAAAVEMIHTATLIHDDIIDGSPFRRGVPSVHSRWGTRTALLAGDYLFARAFLMLAGMPRVVLAGLASAAEEMCAGQARELAGTDYFDAIRAKTAVFLSECCRLGSILARAPRTAVEALGEYGRFLGLAFQITDDMLDVFGDPAGTGKPRGNDLRQGLLTLPVLRCLHSSPKGPRLMELIKAIERQRTEGASDSGELEEALSILGDSDSRDYCLRAATAFARRAADRLSVVRPCAARDSMERLTELIVARTR